MNDIWYVYISTCCHWFETFANVRIDSQEQDPPSLPAEFPKGTRVLFLGDHAYGAAAQVTEATEQALTVELAVSIEH
jgi:hypothetical protein